MRNLGIVLIALSLAGCARPALRAPSAGASGSASYRQVDSRDLAHYQLAIGQVADGAQPVVHPPPPYPPTALEACPEAVEVPARVIVGADGHVREVRLDARSAGSPPAFGEAVRGAVSAWRFQPLWISRWAADASGHSHLVDREARPFTLDYVFLFRCHLGQARVEATPGGNGSSGGS